MPIALGVLSACTKNLTIWALKSLEYFNRNSTYIFAADLAFCPK